MSVHELMSEFRRARGAQALSKGIAGLKKLDDLEARELHILLTNMIRDAKMQAQQAAQRRFLGGRMP